MKVMIPVKNAEAIGIRSIINKREINKILNLLKKPPTDVEENWKLRYQINIDKVKSGSITEVSSVLRDLYKRGKEKDLSIMERKLYENAYQLVMYEIAFAKKIEIDEAGDLVSGALAASSS